MKKVLMLTVIYVISLTQTVLAKTVEVEVHGMTCAFCVDSLERKFRKMEAVSDFRVSLQMKKIRLETSEDSPDIEIIKQSILDAGFTPVKITVLSDENDKK